MYWFAEPGHMPGSYRLPCCLVCAAYEAVCYASAACSLAHAHHLGVEMQTKIDWMVKRTVGVVG